MATLPEENKSNQKVAETLTTVPTATRLFEFYRKLLTQVEDALLIHPVAPAFLEHVIKRQEQLSKVSLTKVPVDDSAPQVEHPCQKLPSYEMLLVEKDKMSSSNPFLTQLEWIVMLLDEMKHVLDVWFTNAHVRVDRILQQTGTLGLTLGTLIAQNVVRNVTVPSLAQDLHKQYSTCIQECKRQHYKFASRQYTMYVTVCKQLGMVWKQMSGSLRLVRSLEQLLKTRDSGLKRKSMVQEGHRIEMWLQTVLSVSETGNRKSEAWVWKNSNFLGMLLQDMSAWLHSYFADIHDLVQQYHEQDESRAKINRIPFKHDQIIQSLSQFKQTIKEERYQNVLDSFELLQSQHAKINATLLKLNQQYAGVERQTDEHHITPSQGIMLKTMIKQNLQDAYHKKGTVMHELKTKILPRISQEHKLQTEMACAENIWSVWVEHITPHMQEWITEEQEMLDQWKVQTVQLQTRYDTIRFGWIQKHNQAVKYNIASLGQTSGMSLQKLHLLEQNIEAALQTTYSKCYEQVRARLFVLQSLNQQISFGFPQFAAHIASFESAFYTALEQGQSQILSYLHKGMQKACSDHMLYVEQATQLLYQRHMIPFATTVDQTHVMQTEYQQWLLQAFLS